VTNPLKWPTDAQMVRRTRDDHEERDQIGKPHVMELAVKNRRVDATSGGSHPPRKIFASLLVLPDVRSFVLLLSGHITLGSHDTGSNGTIPQFPTDAGTHGQVATAGTPFILALASASSKVTRLRTMWRLVRGRWWCMTFRAMPQP
jgi:hypothetical protein